MLLKIYSILLKLDGPVLKNDSLISKLVKRKVLKPIGYYFRRKHYQLKYKA